MEITSTIIFKRQLEGITDEVTWRWLKLKTIINGSSKVEAITNN